MRAGAAEDGGAGRLVQEDVVVHRFLTSESSVPEFSLETQ